MYDLNLETTEISNENRIVNMFSDLFKMQSIDDDSPIAEDQNPDSI